METAPDTIDDAELVERLRQGDEDAFTFLVSRYHASLVRIAQIYVGEREIAEEVAQETWVAVLQGLNRFEGRSSLKTWIFSILANRAKVRAKREGRFVPLPDEYSPEPAVELERFEQPAGHWKTGPYNWDNVPEEQFLSRETMNVVRNAIGSLAPNQREVITLRDVEGWSADEVCNFLTLSETNQRVLLHRARAAVRRALEKYFESHRE